MDPLLVVSRGSINISLIHLHKYVYMTRGSWVVSFVYVDLQMLCYQVYHVSQCGSSRSQVRGRNC